MALIAFVMAGWDLNIKTSSRALHFAESWISPQDKIFSTNYEKKKMINFNNQLEKKKSDVH